MVLEQFWIFHQMWLVILMIKPIFHILLSMKNALKPLAKSVLIPLQLTLASATDPAIQKKNFGSGMTTMIFSNEKMNDIIKIIKSLQDSGILTEIVSGTIENEAKKRLNIIRYTRC